MNKQLSIAGCFGSCKEPQLGSKSFNLELPLRKIHHYVQIINGVAEVEMHQTFLNNSQKFLQVQYKFPIMPNVCLYKFVATFGKTRMEGVVKQKEIAKEEYEQAVSMGKKAALGSIDPESKDILVLQIGNIGPSEEVKIQLCYSEELSISLNTFYQFNFSTKLLPRYMNSIPPQDYLNSFRNTLKTVGGEFEWDFKLKVRASRKIIVQKSPTHQLYLEKSNDQSTEIQFTLAKGESFSKDFTFLYTTQGFQIPSYTLGRTDVSSSVMVSFIPKFCTLDLKDAELAALKPESFETDMDGVRGQYIFLLDRSGSMGGSSMQKAKEALIIFLKSLPIDTYFQVISFGSHNQSLFPTSQKNSNQSIEKAIKQIKLMTANMGGTEIYNPLSKILKSQLIEGYPKQIFLLTDGGVTDTNNVIELVRNNIKYSRTHAIGIGDGVSQALIIGCAQKGKGQHIFIGNGEDPSEKIIQLLNDSLTPIISKVSLTYDPQIVESIVPNPERLPYILKGEVANFYLTFKGQLASPTVITLSYTDSLNGLPFKSQIEVLPDSPSEPFVDKIGNFRRIKALEEAEATNRNAEDFLYYVKATDRKQQIIDLSTKHQILSKHTAFLCVEKQLVDGRYEQVKAKGKEKVQIVDAAPNKKQQFIELLDFASISYNQPSSTYSQHCSQNFFGSSPQKNVSSIPYFSPPLSMPPPPIQSPPLPQIQPSIDFSNFFGNAAPIQPTNTPIMESQLVMKKNNNLQHKKGCFNNLFGMGSSGGKSSNVKGEETKGKITTPIPPPGQLSDLPPPPPPPSFNFSTLPPPPSFKSSFPPPPPLPSFDCLAPPPPPSLAINDPFSDLAFPTSLKSTLPPQPPIYTSSPLESLKTRIVERGKKKSLFDDSQEDQVKEYKPVEAKDQIKQIVSQQQFEGQWSNLQLIGKLFGVPLMTQIENLTDRNVAITLLVAGWIQKNYKQKVYLLILKKATNWLKKQQKYQQYLQDYQKYIQ